MLKRRPAVGPNRRRQRPASSAVLEPGDRLEYLDEVALHLCLDFTLQKVQIRDLLSQLKRCPEPLATAPRFHGLACEVVAR